jgi:hypothetical protein
MLRDFQKLLGAVYGIEHGPDVCDFLVTDDLLLAALEATSDVRTMDEKLLIHEVDDDLGVSLYLNSALLERLAARDPRDRLSGSNLDDFCTVLEGISHFVYLAWNASADKAVTLMEMELQAEVDKYIGARFLLQQQRNSGLRDFLYDRLFDAPRFDPALSSEELDRYQNASNFAGRYCFSLEKRFPDGHAGSGQLDREMLHDLREFYRLPQPGKVSHIQSALFA